MSRSFMWHGIELGQGSMKLRSRLATPSYRPLAHIRNTERKKQSTTYHWQECRCDQSHATVDGLENGTTNPPYARLGRSAEPWQAEVAIRITCRRRTFHSSPWPTNRGPSLVLCSIRRWRPPRSKVELLILDPGSLPHQLQRLLTPACTRSSVSRYCR